MSLLFRLHKIHPSDRIWTCKKNRQIEPIQFHLIGTTLSHLALPDYLRRNNCLLFKVPDIQTQVILVEVQFSAMNAVADSILAKRQ